MDKRYQVFVSSTFEDLQEERKEVIQVLLESNCIPAGMELFQASDDDQWTLIKSVIDDCDYYLVIIGGRYGSTNKDGISYTQMEYEYALKNGKPILAFLHKNPGNIIADKTEQDPEKKKRLEDFRQLAEKKVVRYWDTPENLGGLVSRSIINLINTHPATGWVKADSIVDEQSIAEISRLQKENKELRSKIKEVSTEAPKGSEDLAQGEDKVVVEFNCEGTYFVFDGLLEANDLSYSFELTWNQLFFAIAPSLMTTRYEYEIKCCINDFLAYYSPKTDIFNEFEKYESFRNFEIKQTSFDLIKIQFRALGFITLSFNSGNTFWDITPYGDYMITKLLAVKKK